MFVCFSSAICDYHYCNDNYHAACKHHIVTHKHTSFKKSNVTGKLK